MQNLSFIAAIGKNRELGNKNTLLWSLPDDMKRFREITKGHTVIMGKKTFASLPGGPLPKRRNIVLSRERVNIEGAEVATSPKEALQMIEKEGDEESFVIGGGEIFKLFLPYATHMYLSIVDDSPEADAFFPEFHLDEWNVVSEEFHPADEKHTKSFTFKLYQRK